MTRRRWSVLAIAQLILNMWIKLILQGSLGNRESVHYRGVTPFTELRTAIGQFELQIFEELKSFKDDIRADCLMCYIWPCSDLRADEQRREFRLAKRDRVLEGSGCLDAGFVRERPFQETAGRLIDFGLELLADALALYRFDDGLTKFVREYFDAKSRSNLLGSTEGRR
jgi:hypothetical protein